VADDIVNRLRNPQLPCICIDVVLPSCHPCNARLDGADEIDRLRAEVERLIPFARLIAHAEPYTTIPMDPDDVLWDRVHPTVQEAADARAAVAAYEAARKEADRG